MEILRAAKETIALAEERLLEEDSRQFDSAWQEMLNHATQRVRTCCKRRAVAKCCTESFVPVVEVYTATEGASAISQHVNSRMSRVDMSCGSFLDCPR